MYEMADVIDYYLSSKDANDFMINYLKKCRLTLLKINILNRLFDIADSKLVSEATNNTQLYLEEAKLDRYYLKQIKKIMDKVALNGVNMFEEDFVSLIVCIEIKNKHMANLENYYIEKLTSQVNNHGYPTPQDEDRIEEYNGKIATLVKRLQE